LGPVGVPVGPGFNRRRGETWRRRGVDGGAQEKWLNEWIRELERIF
jgi:hypothetical protein